MVGKSFGRWKVLGFAGNRGRWRKFWKCVCECGTVRDVDQSNLRQGKSLSCGCLQKEIASRSFQDLTGMKFGRLTVIERGPDYISPSNYKYVQWVCECSCGKTTIVIAKNLKSGNTTSCGCYLNEHLRLRIGSNNPTYKHGKSKESNYRRRPRWWSKQIYKRDDGICVCCQNIADESNAHHLNGWDWAIDEREKTSNGVLLCASCHKEFHRWYGKGNNTLEQFLGWMWARNPTLMEFIYKNIIEVEWLDTTNLVLP